MKYNHSARKFQRGFTLIELMIVVAIIGVLAAIAVSQYQDYVSRSRWADTVTAAGAVKAAIGECLQNNNYQGAQCNSVALLQGGNAANANYLPYGVPTIQKYVGTTIDVVAGPSGEPNIEIASVNSLLASCTVTLTSEINPGNVSWSGRVTGEGCTRSNTGFNT